MPKDVDEIRLLPLSRHYGKVGNAAVSMSWRATARLHDKKASAVENLIREPVEMNGGRYSDDQQHHKAGSKGSANQTTAANPMANGSAAHL